MSNVFYFDPVERRHEKARARAADQFALLNARISRADLRKKNSFLASLEIIGSSSGHQGAFL